MGNKIEYGYGLIPLTPERKEELESLSEEYHRKRQAMRVATLAALPIVVDLAPQFPPIRSQGRYGTCVAFASAAILDYWDGKLSGRGANTIVRSPLHLYYPNAMGAGMQIVDAITNANQRGACAEVERPYATSTEEHKFVEPITSKQRVSGDFWKNSAPNPLIKLYKPSSSKETMIQGVKEHLASGIPVLLEIDSKPSFHNPGAGGVITPISGEETTAGHAVVIVGYDDNKGMFKIRNSWGTSWGSGGHGFILYNDIFAYTVAGFYANDYYNFTCYVDGQTLMNPYIAQSENSIIPIKNFKRSSYRFVRLVATRTGSHVFAMNNNDFKLTVLTEDYNTVVALESVKTITANLVANKAYIIQIYCDSTLASVDSATLTMGNGSGGVPTPGTTPGDSYANAITVFGTSASGTLIDTKDLYFKYTAPRTGNYTFTTTSGFDAYMDIIDTDQVTILGSDDDSAGGSQPKVTVPLSAGKVVYPKVYGYKHTEGKYGPVILNITEPASGSAPGAVSLTVGSPTANSLTLTYSSNGATTYDIYRDGVLITAGRTSSTFTDTGLLSNKTYVYYVIARNAYGSTTSTSKSGTTLQQPGPTPVTISEGFEGTKYAFTFTGDWADSKTEASTGTWSRKSKAITHKETSTMQFTENIPSSYAQTPTLKFDYFVSSEANYDYLEVLVNGESKLKASGETGWVKDYTVTLGTGNQTVTFHYVKDGSTSKGQDCAYVDNIRVSY
ncbi:C1 family peptidase [Brevibacillus reuszeri]|uniref:C1 family peptidase n=1 Tax=Brevibacillus reuszeri TaxID=54915 RepID=UPI000CCC9D58|nr:C1 family peptidase [Brevibacillus reuszeri]